MHQQNPLYAPPESRGTTRIRRTPTESCLHLQRDYNVTWCIVREYWNEEDDGNLIEKHRDKFHLKWIISIRQEMVTAMDIIAEHFCRKIFEVTIFLCRKSRENVVNIYTSVSKQLPQLANINYYYK